MPSRRTLPSALVALSLAVTASLLVSCASAPFKDTYALKKKAAASVGGAEGYPTIWNEAKPCSIGWLYFVHAGNKGYVLDSYTSDYAVSGAQWSDPPAPANGSFAYSITSKPSVKAQISYMGLEVSFAAKPVKTVSFSMDGADTTNLREFDKLQQLVDQNLEGQRKAEILHETLARKKSHAPPTYWMVTGIYTAKNLKVSIEKSGNWSGELGVVDPSILKNLLSMSKLPAGSIEVGNQGSGQKQVYVNPDKFPLAVTMFPLSAIKNASGGITVYFDKVQKPLAAINTQ